MSATNRLSRRSLLKATAALPLLKAMPAQAGSAVFAYAGTYSSPQGPEGSKGDGQGIYLFEMNPQTGALIQRRIFADDSNPSWLALHPSRKYLYAANETATFEDLPSGSVSAFLVDRVTGRLARLNTVSSQGAGPAHLSVHPSGKYVLVANYSGGTVAVLPVLPNGGLSAATDVKKDQGSPGSAHASSGPPGSFAISGHDRPHAHMIQSDPSGRFVLSTDLSLDKIFVWRFDLQKGTLSPNKPPFVSLPSGDGPRHFTFHPNGRYLYSLQEESSTIAVFEYDGRVGRLSPKQTVSTLPKAFAGTNFTSEIVVTAEGRFVYAANRLHDTIACFSVGAAGDLTYAGETWTRGDYPRSFSIDPSGKFLYTCNQRSDAIAVFTVNRETGALAFTGQYTPVGTPAMLVFLA